MEEIDRLNIFHATLLAMERAVRGLIYIPDLVLVDGNHVPEFIYPATSIVDGDVCERVISAASILAKVSRDNEMKNLDHLYPQYGFANHKGYATKEHINKLKKFGPCVIHRRSFISKF